MGLSHFLMETAQGFGNRHGNRKALRWGWGSMVGMMHVYDIGVRDPKYDLRPVLDPLVMYLGSLLFTYGKPREWDNL